MSSTESAEAGGGLARGRQKRATAGNRLQALLDEEYVAEPVFDAGDDQDGDFEGETGPLLDIEISESDEPGESSGSGADDRDAEDAPARRRWRPVALFRARQAGGQPRPRRRAGAAGGGPVRHSSRTHTVENKILVDQRLSEHRRRARQSAHARGSERPMTQEERLAEARVTEERNRERLQGFLRMERERSAGSVLRAGRPLAGPFIRFLSRGVSQPPCRTHPADGRSEGGEGDFSSEEGGGASASMSRNYVILEGFPEPVGPDTQRNILFPHADPPTEPAKNQCLITGKAARYRDPASGLCYSDLSAYRAICRVIRGDVPWSPAACTFVAVLRPAGGVPCNFHDSPPRGE